MGYTVQAYSNAKIGDEITRLSTLKSQLTSDNVNLWKEIESLQKQILEYQGMISSNEGRLSIVECKQNIVVKDNRIPTASDCLSN